MLKKLLTQYYNRTKLFMNYSRQCCCSNTNCQPTTNNSYITSCKLKASSSLWDVTRCMLVV